MKVSHPPTAFRLPKVIIATVDAICAREDLTRSQVFRRSVMEYLKNQNAIGAVVKQPEPGPEPQLAWPAELFNLSAKDAKNWEKKAGINYTTPNPVERCLQSFSGSGRRV